MSQTSNPEELGATSAAPCRRLEDGRSPISLFYFYLLSAKLHYLFDQTEEALRLIGKSDEYVEQAFSNPSNAEHRLAHGLIAARAHDIATTRRERRRFRRVVPRSARWLERCAAGCPASCLAANSSPASRRSGDPEQVSQLEAAAITAYAQWGAPSKVARLEEQRHPSPVPPASTPDSATPLDDQLQSTVT